jgi:pimeloyl-ACP methyl ester carboxylesterase
VIEHTHQTAPTQFADGAGIRFAYRRFGKSQGVPLVFFQHFTGTIDNWDPAVTDGLARDRQVVLFNNAGISSSGGETPNTIAEMARDAGAFIDALGLEQIDVLGFSLGGFVAQQLTLDRPNQVRRLVLVGTGPRSGEGMATLTPEATAIFGKTYEIPDELWLEVFFSPTESSQAAGQAFLQRFRARREHRDPPVNEKVIPAQLAAVEQWGTRRNDPYTYLKNIKQPVLVINGNNDVIIYTVNSFILQRNLPNAQLIIYPDSNHGSQYQFPELFVEHVKLFLGELSIGR